MSKVIITGGSGFVGTNLVQHYVAQGWDVLNLDIKAPRNAAHAGFWREVDVRDAANLRRICADFSPTLIHHMGARTDLDGRTLQAYSANTDGVATLIDVASRLPALERVVFASSMLVCRLGYLPRDEFDFAPNTVYGESKVIGEQHVRQLAADRFPWTIVRPTSLWGPWFDVPYRDFFSAVMRQRYVHPRGRKIRRSYGFVLNAVHQLDQITRCADRALVDGRVFYLADYQPVELLAWSYLISRSFKVTPPREVPLALLQGMARVGDVIKGLGVKRVPLSSTRLNNLLTEAVYDLQPLRRVAGDTHFALEAAVEVTVDWMKKELLGK
jgi:nucleoside-diphosphate-sugar epimerase